MTGSVAKKGTRWYALVDFGMQPSRECPTAGCPRIWTGQQGDMTCERCGAALGPQMVRRRREWHGSWGKKAEAKEALTRLLGDIGRGTYVQKSEQTLEAFIEGDWLPGLQLRESTKESYGRNLRVHVLPRIGSTVLQELDVGTLNRLYAELLATGRRGHRAGTGLSPRTVRYVHTILHRALKDAVRWNRLVRNPTDQADPPRQKDVEDAAPEMQTWSGPQLAAFLENTKDTRYGPAWMFLATTGMRRGEALGLRWTDVDLGTGKVAIRQTVVTVNHRTSFGKTKTGRARVIELDARTVAVLRQQKARQGEELLLVGIGYRDDGLVFTLPDGRPYHPERFSREFLRKQVSYNRAHAKAPLPHLTVHGLRHSWATLALRAGEHPKVVAERLGHANTNVTLNVYSHVVEGMQAQAAENVAALIFGTLTT